MKGSPSFPSPYLYPGKQLWSVQIYSFGSLAIEVAGSRLIERPGKSQKKILELLATLVILGGRNISCNQLAEILWPNAEGDLARQSLTTALHRLRRLIGKEAIILHSGMISLNENHCWLDLWVFEEAMDELENTLRNNGPAHIIVKLTDQALKLYRDTFLKNYDSGLAILKQEQLLHKLCRLLDLSVDFHERLGENGRACLLLEKELELKPLVEANYRRLMSHYIHLGQPGHALHIYQRCRRIIHKGFHISLSEEIQRLVKQLQPDERQ